MGEPGDLTADGAVDVVNRHGRGCVVLVCDHASNFLPREFGGLGLDSAEFARHIAWDPGALPVCLELSALLDAPLIASRISRLVIDCNRPLNAPDLIPEISETTVIPGNLYITKWERERRIALAYEPFHSAIDELLSKREAAGLETCLVSIHSFTPVYKGVKRPWDIGIIHDEDERLARPMIEALRRLSGITVGVNEPYSPADRVYHTIATHAHPGDLPCAMVELRNDRIADTAGQFRWAGLLAGILSQLKPSGGDPEGCFRHSSVH